MTCQLEDLNFADDIALVSTTAAQMQRKTTKLSETASKIGLKINQKKTEVFRINSKDPSGKIKFSNGEEIREMNEFVYLGATMSDSGERRFGKAKSTFGRLRKVWESKKVSRGTKIQLYNILVKPVLLYGCETWKINVADNARLNSFQYKCLKRMLGIYWLYIASQLEVNEKCGCDRLSNIVKQSRWRWIGHVLRMEKDHNCVTALTWTPVGRCKVGRPRKTWR